MQKFVLAAVAICLIGCGSQTADVLNQTAASGNVQSRGTLIDEAPPVQAPRAFDDTFRLADDDPLVVSVLDNDTHQGGRVVAFDAQGSRGGQVSISPDGILTYVPPPGNQPGRDVFGYTVQNSAGLSRASVTAIQARTLYVNNQAAPNGDGSKGRPFNTLQGALDSAGGNPAHIFVAQGDGTSRGLDPAQINLESGQAIQGQDGKKPPHIHSAIHVSTFNCHLESLILEGVAGPTITGGDQASGFSNPPLILNHLVMQDSDTEAMRFEQPDNTEITDLRVLRHNRRSGEAALVFRNPFGQTKISGLIMQDNPRAGVLLENTEGGDYGPNGIPFEINGFTPNGVHNPLLLRCSAGHVQFRLSGFGCNQKDDLSGTLFTGDISNNAFFEGWLSSLDFRQIGDQTGILDWTYRNQSTGTLRFGSSSTDYRKSANRPYLATYSNGLHFVTRDSAQGNLVFSGTLMSGANPTNIDAYNDSLAKVRLTHYSWEDDHDFDFQMWAHDRAQIFSRIFDGKSVYGNREDAYDLFVVPHLLWRCDLESRQRIEAAYNLDYDNPTSFNKWVGFDKQQEAEAYDWFTVLTWQTKNFSDARVDELQIPQP